MIKVPPYLKKGACIGITFPAGYMAAEKAQTCINTLQGWGFEVMVGKLRKNILNEYMILLSTCIKVEKCSFIRK